MSRLRAVLPAFVPLLALACATTPSTFTAGPFTRARVDSRTARGPEIVSREQLDALRVCLSRAHRVTARSGRRWTWTHRISLSGPRGGTYLYDQPTGELTRLDPFAHPVYRLEGIDRECLSPFLPPPDGPGH